MTMSPGPAEGGGRLFTLDGGSFVPTASYEAWVPKSRITQTLQQSQAEACYFFGDGRFSVTVVFG